MGTHTSKLTFIDNEIFIANWTTFKPAFKDLAYTGGITRLR